MIEPLESRTLFSVTPQAALVALRADVASIGTKIESMITANKWAIKVLTRQIPGLGDKALLQNANFEFNANVAVLEAAFKVTKALLGQDITRLINVTNTYNLHPTSAVLAQRVITAEKILTAQGSSSATVLSEDVGGLETAYINSLSPIPAAHPINSTLAISIGSIATSFDEAFSNVAITAQTISAADIPSFITALEPNGVLTNAA